MKIFSLLLTLSFSFSAWSLTTHLKDQIETEKLYRTKQWYSLLHYREGLLGIESEIDDANFFVSAEGAYSPKKELSATVKKIIEQDSSTKESERVICRFPARAKWLKNVLNLAEAHFDFNNCKKYKNFTIRTTPKSVYLVFSSYFLESPGSAFGHTFLRFSKKDALKHEKYSELLDAGINYGATVTTENPLMYALFGIVGGFQGRYSLLPYYYKVREYNNSESRDLWSYKLNLSREQITKLIDHLWEVGDTWSSYFFFTENCSYNVLTLLEAVNPKWELTNKLPFYVIPVDTIKAIHQTPGLLSKNPTYRPSVKKQFEHAYSNLTSQEKEALDGVLEQRKLALSKLDENTKSRIVDTAIKFIDYRYNSEVLKEKGKNFKFKQKLLLKRSRLPAGGPLDEMPVPKDETPHLGHGSKRLDIGAGNSHLEGSYEELGFRFALHDLLDPVVGQPEFAAIDFFSFSARYYNETQKALLEKFNFVEVTTLNPLSYKRIPLSLSARVSLERTQDGTCNRCMHPNINFATGFSKTLGPSVIGALFDTDIAYSNDFFRKDYKLSVGPKLYTILRWNNILNTGLTASWKRHIFQKLNYWTFDHESRIHVSKSFSLRLKNKVDKLGNEHFLGLSFYF